MKRKHFYLPLNSEAEKYIPQLEEIYNQKTTSSLIEIILLSEARRQWIKQE